MKLVQDINRELTEAKKKTSSVVKHCPFSHPVRGIRVNHELQPSSSTSTSTMDRRERKKSKEGTIIKKEKKENTSNIILSTSSLSNHIMPRPLPECDKVFKGPSGSRLFISHLVSSFLIWFANFQRNQ